MKTSTAVLLTAAITALVTSAFWLGVAVITVTFFLDSSSPFQVTADFPTETTVGEEIDVTVTIVNPHDEEIEFDSIDVYDSLLEGFEFLGMTPEPKNSEEYFDFQSYFFAKALQPQESLNVVLHLKAETPGYYSGDVDVCTPEMNWTTVVVGIQVAEGEGDRPIAESSMQFKKARLENRLSSEAHSASSIAHAWPR